ncbi:hypothetical protein [Enterococcus sp. DIV0876]|uniref:hypothetical protein n=1 Tax=Enterococcus sp. DIV0876 TaxID=2774633 RepID=UPI003D2FE628
MLENFEPKQPQLNENQQIVLDWLKKKCDSKDDFMGWYPFEAIMHLSVGLDPGELRIVPSIQELTYKQEIEVLQVFSQWALEREEE